MGAARRKVSHHYDLKPELFDLFLDSDRQYSCAYFASDNDDIETAQRRKKAHLAAKLLLRPGDRVLDIGSGWGGLGLYLAEQADVDVTGVTLSHEQHELSNARAAEAGLSERCVSGFGTTGRRRAAMSGSFRWGCLSMWAWVTTGSFSGRCASC